METIIDHEDADLREQANMLAREQRRAASRPDIDELEDAIVIQNDKLVCRQGKGMRIIIERYASSLKNRPWLDTRTYIINSVNQETGELKLWDEELEHHASSNFITGTQELGYRFKIPATKKAYVPKEEKPEAKKEEKKATPTDKPEAGKERRVYETKGVIHTRLKGVAYVPPGNTLAKDGMRLMMTLINGKLHVEFPGNVNEVWLPNKDM